MRYFLVQRLAPRYKDPARITTLRGFDGFFEFEYMGSPEYEFRTPYECLQRMRAVAPVVVQEHFPHPSGEYMVPVYFVGGAPLMGEKIQALREWLNNPRSQEPSYFPEALAAYPKRAKFAQRTVAWWSFDGDIAWTFDPDMADELVAGFRGQPASAL